MKRFIAKMLCLILLSVFGFIPNNFAQDKGADYTSYNIARQYQKDRNMLFAYKYLIIFKYSNLDILKKTSNYDALVQIDNQIAQLEKYINAVEYRSTSRGFTPDQLDSIVIAQRNKVKTFKDIKLIN
jgi:hypothetical protein